MCPLFDSPQFEAIVPALPQMYGNVDNLVAIYLGDEDDEGFYTRPIAVPTGLFKFMSDVLGVPPTCTVSLWLEARYINDRHEGYLLNLWPKDRPHYALWAYKTLPVWAER